MQSGELVKKHYKEQAAKYGASPQSTMEDEVIREKEITLILNFCAMSKNKLGNRNLRILDLGCGNGYALSVLSKGYPANSYWGVDFSKELLSIAKDRKLPNCRFMQGDVRRLSFDSKMFDVVYSERCLINILNWEEQKLVLHEIRRVLVLGGYYLMIECFTDGLLNNNKARKECGLSELKEAYHNKYFDKDLFLQAISKIFTVVEPAQFSRKEDGYMFHHDFLSSHYFIARVLHPLVTKGESVKNTEFVKFFSSLPPVGNYSPIQAYILKNSCRGHF